MHSRGFRESDPPEDPTVSHVIIVGAGPAGASLAYLFASRGVRVTLFERQKDFAREFRGEILQPSGVDVFTQMGLAAKLEGVAHHAQQSAQIYMNGRLFFQREIQSGDPRFLAISQPGLLEMLVGEASQFDSFQFKRGVAMKDLLREDGRVVGIRAATDAGDEDFRADLVIGADGRSSAVRRHASIPANHISPPMDIVWCKLPCPEGWDGVRAYAGRGHLLVAYHTWDNSLQLGWVILKGTFGELKSRGIEQWVQEMANHVTPDLAEHLRAHQDAIQKPFLLSAVSDCVEHWSVPGALLIGDAAHTMSPVGGQGVNIALRDAIVAANHLVPVLSEQSPDPSSLDNALRAIEDERLPEIREIQAFQAQPPKLILTHAWWGEPVRSIIARLVSRPAVQRRAGKRVSLFLNGATEVRLDV